MEKRIIRSLLLVVLLIVAIAMPVLAQAYYAVITFVESSGNDYDMLAMVVSANVTYMAAEGFIAPDGLDTRVEIGGVDLPHMLADDKILFASSVNATSTQDAWFTMGNTLLTSFDVIAGYGGTVSITDADNPVLRLGDEFAVLLKGWVDTTAGANKYMAIKTNAFEFEVSAANTVTATVDPAGAPVSVSKAGLISGEYAFVVSANTTHLHLWVDSGAGLVLEDTSALGGSSVPQNANAWALMQNNVMPYMEYFVIWRK